MKTCNLPDVRAALLLGVVVSAACASSTSPTPTSASSVSSSLQLSCPSPATAESVTGQPRGVDYAAPTAQGGAAPVNVTCTPASGTTLPVGTTNIKCTAVDGRQQQAACDFNISVTQPGNLSATRFLAFGDSITWGSESVCPGPPPAGLSVRDAIIRDALLLRPRADPPSSAYPNVLFQLLSGRYVSQSIAVANVGWPGERLTEDSGGTLDDTVIRLRGELSSRRPQVLLLQEGANDLIVFNHEADRTPRIAKALGDLIREARGQGVQVLLGTLLPQDPSCIRGSYGYDLVTTANEHIRHLATSEGVPLVDLYAAFGGVAGMNIGNDGLHPSAQGYEKMAQTFLTVIRERLEVPR